jgi:hypothetical protein
MLGSCMFYASEGFKIVAGLKTIFHTKNCEVFHIDSKRKIAVWELKLKWLSVWNF